MSNQYYTASSFIPYTSIKAEDINITENNTEAAFDLLPNPITTGIDTGFTENFKILEAPVANENVLRLGDLFTNQYLYGSASCTDGQQYSLTISPGPSTLTEGIWIYFKIGMTNTGASTLNLNNLGAKSILTYDGRDLTGGELVKDKVCVVIYNGSSFQLMSQTSNIAAEAPQDGEYYCRRNATWIQIPISTTVLEAKNVVFDDSSTSISASTVQEYLESSDAALLTKVPLSGGTMTGNLTIQTSSPRLSIKPTSVSSIGGITFTSTSSSAAINVLDSTSTEIPWITFNGSSSAIIFEKNPQTSITPTNVDDLVNKNYVDTTFVSASGGIFTGAVSFTTVPSSSATPSNEADLVNKNYVDSLFSSSGFVPISGGTFTGKVNFTTIPSSTAVPTNNNDLITLGYFNQEVGEGPFVPASGGTFTGTVSFSVFPQCSGTPTQNDDLINKSYFDSHAAGNCVPITGGTFTGAVSFTTVPSSSATPVNNDDLTNKSYVDTKVSTAISCCSSVDDKFTILESGSGNAQLDLSNSSVIYSLINDGTKWSVSKGSTDYIYIENEEINLNEIVHLIGSTTTSPKLKLDLSDSTSENGVIKYSTSGLRLAEENNAFGITIKHPNITMDGQVIASEAPTTTYSLTNKTYVDTLIAGLQSQIDDINQILEDNGLS